MHGFCLQPGMQLLSHRYRYCISIAHDRRFVRYCMSRIEMLLHNGVIPVVVFDGGRLPTKADEEDSRRR